MNDQAPLSVLSSTQPPLVGLITIWHRASESEIGGFLSNLQSLDYMRLQPVFVVYRQAEEDVARLSAAVPHAIVRQVDGNLGPAAGWNRGISCLLDHGAEYIGMWNVDVRLAIDCVSRLASVLEADRRIGAVGPLLLYSDEPCKAEMYGGSVDFSTGESSHDFNGVTDMQALPPYRDAQYLDGGTLIAGADVFKRVGTFDDQLFMYAEDSDFSYRIQQAGYRTVAVRDARAWHYHREKRGRFASPYESFYRTRNKFYLAQKHRGTQARWTVLRRTLAMLPRLLVHYLYRHQVATAWAHINGIIAGMAGRMGKRGWVE